jgi:hypothetical protein
VGQLIFMGRIHFMGRFVIGHVGDGQSNRQIVDEGACTMRQDVADLCTRFSL